MKLFGYITVYNDYEFLEETIIQALKFVDELYIIEGAWQSSIVNGYEPRSDHKTYDIINKYLGYSCVKLFQLNEKDETAQRQKALDLCREAGADWVIMMDADEVYPDSIGRVIRYELENKKDYIGGFQVRSYNFLNGTKKYYNGLYPRIYSTKNNPRVAYHNHVTWDVVGMKYETLGEDCHRFFHYGYMRKNISNFENKVARLNTEFNSRLLENGYSVDSKGKYTVPIPEDEIFEFLGEHPGIMLGNGVYKKAQHQK